MNRIRLTGRSVVGRRLDSRYRAASQSAAESAGRLPRVAHSQTSAYPGLRSYALSGHSVGGCAGFFEAWEQFAKYFRSKSSSIAKQVRDRRDACPTNPRRLVPCPGSIKECGRNWSRRRVLGFCGEEAEAVSNIVRRMKQYGNFIRMTRPHPGPLPLGEGE
jgi:hypothetical protein